MNMTKATMKSTISRLERRSKWTLITTSFTVCVQTPLTRSKSRFWIELLDARRRALKSRALPPRPTFYKRKSIGTAILPLLHLILHLHLLHLIFSIFYPCDVRLECTYLPCDNAICDALFAFLLAVILLFL